MERFRCVWTRLCCGSRRRDSGCRSIGSSWRRGCIIESLRGRGEEPVFDVIACCSPSHVVSLYASLVAFGSLLILYPVANCTCSLLSLLSSAGFRSTLRSSSLCPFRRVSRHHGTFFLCQRWFHSHCAPLVHFTARALTQTRILGVTLHRQFLHNNPPQPSDESARFFWVPDVGSYAFSLNVRSSFARSNADSRGYLREADSDTIRATTARA